MNKEIEPQQGDEIGKAPGDAAAHLQIFEQEDGNECCPNLDAYRIGRCADEGLDLEVFFQGLEEEFDLPALLVNGSDGGSSQFEVVGQDEPSRAARGNRTTNTPPFFKAALASDSRGSQP